MWKHVALAALGLAGAVLAATRGSGP
jgi:hypothetical protein